MMMMFCNKERQLWYKLHDTIANTSLIPMSLCATTAILDTDRFNSHPKQQAKAAYIQHGVPAVKIVTVMCDRPSDNHMLQAMLDSGHWNGGYLMT